MNKNINKVIAAGITVSMINGGIIPSFAAENAKTVSDKNNSIVLNSSTSGENTNTLDGQTTKIKKVITLDELIKSAVDNSDKLALKEKELKLYEDKLDLQDEKDDFYEDNKLKTGNDTVDDFPSDKLKLQKKQTAQSEAFLQDQITNDVTKRYNVIILKKIDIDKLKTGLEIKNNDLDALKMKVSVGLAIPNQLEDKQIELNKAQDEIKAKENSLKNNLDYLGVLTNLNLSDYTLDSSISYEILKIDGSLDQYLDDKIDSYLKYNDEIIELTDDYMHGLREEDMNKLSYYENKVVKVNKNDYYEIDGDGNKTFNTQEYCLAIVSYVQQYLNAFNNYQSYLEGRYSLAEAKVKLDDSKKSLKNVLKENYSTLCDLENQIKRLNEQIISNNTKLRSLKAKVDLGIITDNDYKAELLKSKDLDNSLINLINTYNILKNSIEKPWVLSSN